MLMTRKIFTECKLVHADLSEYNILYHIDDTEPQPVPAAEPSPHAPTDPSNQTTSTSSEEERPAPPRRGHLCIIDVSQSVEHDHPHAFDFLRSDLRNIEDFFAKRGVRTVGLRRAFEFVTRERLPSPSGGGGGEGSMEEEEAAVLRAWMDAPEPDAAAGRDGNGRKEGEGEGEGAGEGGRAGNEDEVFMRSYIPRTLNEVYDPERDVGVLSRGEGAQLIYKDTIGIVGPGEGRKGEKGAAPESVLMSAKSRPGGAPKKGVTFADEAEGAVENAGEDGGEGGEDEDGGSEEEEESGDGEEDEEGGEGFKEKKPRGHRHEDKEAKKVRS